MSANPNEDTWLIDDGEETQRNSKIPYVSEKHSTGHSDHDKARSRWITVEPVVFLALIGSGTFQTIRSQYLQRRIATEVYNYTYATNASCLISNQTDPDYLRGQHIQADAADWSMYLVVCCTLPLIFTGILFGKWSDNAGRKMAIGLPLIGMLIQSSTYLTVIAAQLPLPVLFAGEFAFGVTGGNPLLVSVSLAYIADITTLKERTFRVVIVQTCLTTSMGVAQLAIGYLTEAGGFIAPFYLILTTQLVALAYVLIPGILYESVQCKGKSGTLGSQMIKLLHGIIDLFTYNEENRRWRLLLMNAIFFPIIVVVYGYKSIITLYAIGQPFCWSSVFVGNFMTTTMVLFSVGKYVSFVVLGCL